MKLSIIIPTYNEAQIVEVSLIYYPGWKIFLNEQEFPSLHLQDQMGRISFQAPAGEHHLELKFTETPLRLATNVISLLTLLFISGSLINSFYNYFSSRKIDIFR